MFKKCLKYDLRAFGKIWLIAAAVVLAVAILGGIGMGNFVYACSDFDTVPQSANPDTTSDLWFFTQLFVGLISIFAVFSAVTIFMLGTEIAICLRYYNHLFTDQGYLTFTLPVKRSTLFWSKTVSGYMFMAGSFIMYVIALTVSMIGVGGGVIAIAFKQMILEHGITLGQLLRNLWTELWTELTLRMLWDGIVYVLSQIGALNILRVFICASLLLILGLVSLFTSLMLSYACITLGATMFRKRKLLSVLVTYYIINNVLAVPALYFSSYYGMFAAAIGAVALPKLFENMHIGMSVIYLGLTIAILASLCVGVSLAIFNLTRIEHKLNLA